MPYPQEGVRVHYNSLRMRADPIRGAFHVAEVTSRFVGIPAFLGAVESFGFQLEKQSAPSTHFTLFKFTKTSDVPQGPVKGETGWESRVKEGEAILRGCVYKKR